ncbi:hypothetical protein OM076_30140 [Solirubrobacter ginsenosidimutans]|uniref:Esterase-like activity of phytase family protein n=1 Tax=Solirubrobacter ginsenosidimutans TaxID=490573 RepID=A0A9X3N018_9ACTN|nr:hypothetical protein [Solirubrobacter ginsenosidimutans]MDA0164568.1 hypothetical protein [Solirubrobacter ginsenosidimutans]
MRRSWVIAVCAAGLVAPGSALAAGGPVPPVQGGQGISTTGSPVSYVAVAAGGNTRIERREGGTVQRGRVLDGHYGVPGAAYDGSTTGLSADGRTLVLARITRTYPPKSTRLLVLDTQTLAVRNRINLPGFLAVDAISPGGATLYVLRYRNANLVHYDVLALDVPSGQLRGKPIMDPREPDEKMGGIPLARTMSADGRWAYTLYTGEENFVHALDTETAQARCIDLPAGDFSSAGLRLDGNRLHVGAAATIDLQTFALATAPGVATPTPTPTPRATPTPAPAKDDGGVTWPAIALGVAVLGGLGLLARRLRAHPAAEPLEVEISHHVDADRTREKATH